MCHYGGTLAAIRSLGQRGVRVIAASDRAMAPGAWSRHVTSRVRCPSTLAGPRAIGDWLVAFGRRQPGAVLYPTSDDMAWVVSRFAPELAQDFQLFAPPITALRDLLDKSVLYATCTRLGIAVPQTYLPRNEAEVSDLCPPGRTMLVKPRAQMFCPEAGKGARIIGPLEGRKHWRKHRKAKYARDLIEEVPGLDLPLIQEYASSAEGAYSISGFIDPLGRVVTARASKKVLQNPPVTGVGMCFVADEVDPAALAQIVRLCREVSYFGAFEVEFVSNAEGRRLLIDFNPRYYGQMGFDIARGAPIPWLVYQAALGRAREPVADTTPEGAPTVYFDATTLAWRLAMGLLAGSVTFREAEECHRLIGEMRQRSADGWWSSDDRMPAVLAAAGLARSALRHPRAAVTSVRHGLGLDGCSFASATSGWAAHPVEPYTKVSAE